MLENGMSQIESQGIIAHKDGHIYLKHLEDQRQLIEEEKYKILQKRELEADAYAIQSSFDNAKGLMIFLAKQCLYESLIQKRSHLIHPHPCKRLELVLEQMEKLYPEKAAAEV
jgi:Zn-dependent protease with chaperone function